MSLDALELQMENYIKSYPYKYEISREYATISFIIHHPDNKMYMSYNIYQPNDENLDKKYCLYISMRDDCVDTSMFVDFIDYDFSDINFNTSDLPTIFENEIKLSIELVLNGFKNGFNYID